MFLFADIKFLFLVGGFAESLLVQHEIRSTFGHLLRILIPQDVSLTILKGHKKFAINKITKIIIYIVYIPLSMLCIVAMFTYKNWM